LEDVGQHLGRNADPVVTHAYDSITSFPFSGQPNVSPRLCVFGGVIQKIREHLGEPDGIGIQRHRLWRQADSEFVAALLDEGSAAFESTLHHRYQFSSLLADVQFVTADARNIEKIVYESH